MQVVWKDAGQGSVKKLCRVLVHYNTNVVLANFLVHLCAHLSCLLLDIIRVLSLVSSLAVVASVVLHSTVHGSFLACVVSTMQERLRFGGWKVLACRLCDVLVVQVHLPPF